MITLPTTISVPLYQEPDGTIRIAGTRLLLSLVIIEFQRGATVNSIRDVYDTLTPEMAALLWVYYYQNRHMLDTFVSRDIAEGEARLIELERDYPKYLYITKRP